MKIEFNNQIKGWSYGSLSGGDVFADRPPRTCLPCNVFIKPIAGDDEYAISLDNGDLIHFDDEEVVYPLNATLVIND